MIARVTVSYLDNQGNPLWHYSRETNITGTDPEQTMLAARGEIAEGLKQATDQIGKQADEDLKTVRG